MRKSAGLSMVEALLAIVVVAGLGLAAINAVGRVASTQRQTADSALGQWLAHDLMAEIMSHPFEGSDAEADLGPSSAERSQANRSGWDDVDDYNGLIESPPRDARGTSIVSAGTGWSRTTRVAHFTPPELGGLVPSERALKVIEISVLRHSRPVITLRRVRSESHDEAIMYPPSLSWATTTMTTTDSIDEQPR